MSDIDEIAAFWGQVDAAPRLIAQRENAVYEAVIGGQRLALRLHRAGYQSQIAIESELRWTSRMAAIGFPCPAPVAALDGAFLRAVPGGSFASAVTWVDGDAIGDGDTPLGGTLTEQTALYSAVGALIAAFHDASDTVPTGDIQRLPWDADALVGDAPTWGRFWENPTLSTAEADRLQMARARAFETLINMEAPDAGLIHADCLQENIMTTPSGLALIDFDDAGFGYRGYDLGSAMIQHHAHPNLTKLTEALLSGYRTLRPAPTVSDVFFFMSLRAMASCGWAITRCEGNAAAQRAMADRALACVEIWESARDGVP
ncbi:phosphotransferase enzyme family protein [Shimia ponticola]|uniref:phosphotransferase enzyme family protein n=1 Tax=Shimia ponticola TaxID=2582893 RepID=UPI0011BDC6E9|nr:phosphotransferase [Shimia ponticola]